MSIRWSRHVVVVVSSMVLACACGCATVPPPALPAVAAPMPPSYLDVVRRYANTMIKRGRDTYGPERSLLFLSALDREAVAPLTSRPAAPAGIRREDRCGEPWDALVGANPHRDENLLRVLYALTEITGDAKYAAAADREVEWFFGHAMSAKTGLLAWGEHMSWDVMHDRPISGTDVAIHEFARPWALWERSFALAPEACRRFALGLWEHQIANHMTGGFDRHAAYFEHGPADGRDFPRHAGFYIVTWAHAWRHTKDPTFTTAIEALLARFERKRVQKDGTMINTIPAVDCESAAALVGEPLAGRLRAFAAAEDDVTVAGLKRRPPGSAAAMEETPLWRGTYGGNTLAAVGMTYVARLRQVDRPELRDAVVAIADEYAGAVPDEDVDVWPMTFAHAIGVEVAAWRFTGRAAYLREAERLCDLAVRLYWEDRPLPRASLKTGHYESITGGDSLALALLETYAAVGRLGVEIPENTLDR
jgi:hypothetical protein